MIKLSTICSVIILFTSCTGSEPQNKFLTYQNIIILSDMSSRLNNMPQKDIDEIYRILDYFKNECVKPGEKIGDKSSISFSVFSQKVAASIDIDQIKNLGEKQSFINSTGKYKNSGLEHELVNFKARVKTAYDTIRNPGLDLISILIEKIENESIVKENTYLTDGIDTTNICYSNHIYIFTDGYLEYLNKSTNLQFYFGSSEINKVRQYCIINNVDITTALKMNKSLNIPPFKSDKNKYINLHIQETHERDKNIELQTYKYPTGQRDNEILEAVWRKWAKESGFMSFEWDKY
jgi:hypothetical protein